MGTKKVNADIECYDIGKQKMGREEDNQLDRSFNELEQDRKLDDSPPPEPSQESNRLHADPGK